MHQTQLLQAAERFLFHWLGSRLCCCRFIRCGFGNRFLDHRRGNRFVDLQLAGTLSLPDHTFVAGDGCAGDERLVLTDASFLGNLDGKGNLFGVALDFGLWIFAGHTGGEADQFDFASSFKFASNIDVDQHVCFADRAQPTSWGT